MTGTSLRRRAKRVDHPPSYRPCTWHCLAKRRWRFEAPQLPYRSRVTGTSELPSMHLALPRETPEAFQGNPATYRFPKQALDMPTLLRRVLCTRKDRIIHFFALRTSHVISRRADFRPIRAEMRREEAQY